MQTQSPALATSPVIVDDESILPDSLVAACQEAHKGGLLASSDYGSSIASMSGYVKNQAYAYDYGTATRPDQAPGYPTYVQPSYGISYTGAHAQVPSGLPNAAELPLLSEDQYQTHDANYSQQNGSYPTYMPAQPRQIPEVTSFSPPQGTSGRKLFVYLNATSDLSAPPTPLFTVMFGSKRCPGALLKLSPNSQNGNYAVSVDVPPFDTTGSGPTTVPLYLEMSEGGNPSSMPMEFGHYIYTDATNFQLYSPSQSTMRKRKLSTVDDDMRTPTKRSSNQQLRDSPVNSTDGSKTSPISVSVPEPYMNRPQTATVPMSRSYTAPQHQYSTSVQSAPGYSMGQQYAPNHTGMSAQQPQFNSYPPYMTPERASAPAQSHMLSMSAPPGPNPPLIRTTALQGSPTAVTHQQPASFNPYAMYPSNSKANLKLDGDLDGMSKNWTADERSIQRRIVRFRRSQAGSTITASFEPVTPEEHAHAPGCIYVNCIWWAEREACYITSVDTIQLLESLVAVRFTVEEKNRIRRNLEGFRPLTVSKTRPDCEEFFKVIMGFPSPKPRNIEKDVKVFPWRILAHALKKIIGKYSASYSSTAAALPSPGMIGRPQMSTHSPPIANNSSVTMGYAPNMTTAAMPAHHAGLSAGGMAGGSAGPPGMRLDMPVSQNVSWHQPSAHYANDLGAANRGSWDFSQYMDPAGNAPGMPQYQRIPSISQSLGGGYGFVPPQPDWKDYPHRTTHA